MNALVLGHRRSFALAAFLFIQLSAFGQLVANFTATPVSGCAPIVVYFKDSSTGNPTQWKWDLGNGVTSTLKDPSATYFSPGQYNIKLIVSNSSGTDSVIKNQFITVYSNPVGNFTVSDSVGCAPFTVKFSDLSTVVEGTISKWNWDFGDGNVSTQKDPIHVYKTSGVFTVILNVTNSFGCTKTFTKNSFIQVSPEVKTNFTISGGSVCSVPATVQFSNTTTGPGTLTYTWDFGDENTSTETNPAHVYNAGGTYSVTLIAISSMGCRDTLKKTGIINIGAGSSKITKPDVICSGEPAAFTNTASPTPASSIWSFGDGTTSSAKNPIKIYSTPGIYELKLVNTYDGCKDSTITSITVFEKPKAAFTSSIQSTCQVPVTVQFTSQSTGATSLLWDFGDGTTSTGFSPAHTYTRSGKYNVTLIASNASGCTDTLKQTGFIDIQRAGINVAGLPQKGCGPITINPSATVANGEAIVSYNWSFGDGTTSNLASPSHTYTTNGNYHVTVMVTTSGGCVDTLIMQNAVRVGDKPKAQFQMQVEVCAFESVSFSDSSTGNPDQWLWDFGDGGTSTDRHPIYQYSDTGWFEVKLIIWNNTCADSITVKNAVYVKPPIAAFKVDPGCEQKYIREFKDRSIGAETWDWNFGDGNKSTLKNPNHTYAKKGTYNIKLVVTNGSCSHFTDQTINIYDEKANFKASDTIACKNAPVTFTSIDVDSASIANWEWKFGDGFTSSQPLQATHSFTKSGTYSVLLKITDKNGCVDSQYVQIKIYGPTANFSTTVIGKCLSENVVLFRDSSSTDGIHGIRNWMWNFGDGNTDTTQLSTFNYSYSNAGTFNNSLTVTDAYGCTDTKIRPSSIVIVQPKADFIASDTLICIGKEISFQNLSTGSKLKYNWSFGDGTNSTISNPIHSYTSVGQYSVQLSVTDEFGCKDTLTKKDYIRISYPKAMFVMSDSVATCPPLLVNFTNQSSDYVSLHWDFGDGTISNMANPSRYYTDAGTYIVKLTVTGPGGCTDTFIRKIVINGPSGIFTYAPLEGCNPLKVSFKATTKNATSFIWDFSDGSTLSTKDSIISHTYTAIGSYQPKLILLDGSGCIVPIIGPDMINVKGAKADFIMDATVFCNSGKVNFTNTTQRNDSIVSYQWTFGDGASSTEENPSHTYSDAGAYTVQLTVKTFNGCTDSIIKKDTIKVHSVPQIFITGDSTACAPATFILYGNVTVGDAAQMKWLWSFGNGKTSVSQNPTLFMENAATDYVTLVATDLNGCRDTAGKTLNVFPVPETNAGPDRWICRGSATELNATGATNYQWKSSSSLSCTDCPRTMAAPTDSTLYIVTGTNQYGCEKKDSVVIKVHQPFTLQVNPGDTICVGNKINLQAKGADFYTWYPSIGVADPNNPNTSALPQQSTLYKVVAKDKNNCFVDTGSVYIKVWPIPTVDVISDHNLTVGQSLQLTTKNSPDVTSWKWTPATSLSCSTCPDPKAAPKQTTNYEVQVKNDGGCINKATLRIFVTCQNGNVFLPNTFSPNGDGVNDIFYARGSGISQIKLLRIFNRWGEVVFEKQNFNVNDIAAGWNGTFKGLPLSPDVYIYTCDVVCENNEILNFKGDVSLIK